MLMTGDELIEFGGSMKMIIGDGDIISMGELHKLMKKLRSGNAAETDTGYIEITYYVRRRLCANALHGLYIGT